jgi:hypothetical protein
MAAQRTPDQVRADIQAEREQLAQAVEHLRGSLAVTAKLKRKLPLVTAAASLGLVLRHFARRGRD